MKTKREMEEEIECENLYGIVFELTASIKVLVAGFIRAVHERG